MFVDGYVMFDSCAATPALGAAKTITQIVFEQMQDCVSIRYGTQTKYLNSNKSRTDIGAVLAEI